MSVELPGHGPCFVCGPESPLAARLSLRDDGHVEARLRLPLAATGPPGHAHGGALAAILDEIMGAAAWAKGHRVMAVHLEFDYKVPVPLDIEVVFLGWIDAGGDHTKSRKVLTRATVTLPDGRVAAAARGVFAQIPEALAEGFRTAIEAAWTGKLG